MKHNAKHILFIIFFLVGFSAGLNAQSGLPDKTIELTQSEYTLKSLLDILFDDYSINLSYNQKIINTDAIIHLNKKHYSLKSLLDIISEQTGTDYSTDNGVIIIKPKKNTKKYSVNGIIKDKNTGETLPYSSIIVENESAGTISNKYGFYSITLPEGTHTIIFKYIGYTSHEMVINLDKNQTINIDLELKAENLEGVTIKPEQNNLLSFERKLSTLEIKDIKVIPASLGEADVLRSCQSVPGVVSIVEAGGGYFVRGSAWDQNLMLLDEAVVYNAAHIEGFFSVFNPDALKDLKFYKGGIPANYGGRIASVLDITQKEGNMKSYHVNGGIGLIASKLMVEGPVIKDKASFVAAFRRSYMDIFFKYLPDEDIQNSRYYFYDINAKLNFILSRKDRLYISLYSGDDHLIDDLYSQKYGNLTTTVRWNHIFGKRLFSNTSLIYSDYVMEDADLDEYWKWKNIVGIDHYEFKNNFTFYASGQKFDMGVSSQYLIFHPGNRIPLSDSSLSINLKIPDQYSLESAVYLNDIIKVSPKTELLLGLRFSHYMNLGPEDIFIYEEGYQKDESTITDTLHFGNNEIIKQYSNFEPRLSVKYELHRHHVLKLTYNRMAQYINRISQDFMPLPVDMYKPSNKYIRPVICNQLALGYFLSFPARAFDLSAEIYYKKTDNIIEVQPGSDIYLNRTLDAELLQGTGKAYGIEILVNKTIGKFSGSLSYTYSRSVKKVKSEYRQETLNFGEYYPAHYDIPHQIKLTTQHELNTRWTFYTDFVYLTGRPISLPDGQFIYAETLIPYYSGINRSRLPDYHRLNIGVTRKSAAKPNRKWKGYWNFSIYNLYARKNAHSIYIQRKSMSRDTEAVKFYIIGTAIPSLSYHFEF